MFDDRLVFESPGTLPGNVKPDNIRHTHFSRNPHIAQFLKAYEFVKEFGEGVYRMSREMEAVDMLPPIYHLDAFILKVTARACPPINVVKKESSDLVNVPVNVPVSLTETQRKAIEIIKSNLQITHRGLALMMSVSDKTARRTTKALC